MKLKKIVAFAVKHKWYVFPAIFVLLAVGGYYGYQTFTGDEVRYVSQAAAKGSLITSVSGTGSVAASSQVEIKPKVSGDITAVKVKLGQEVKKGDAIAQLNAKDAVQAVRDAQISLETAKLSLEKVKAPADALSLIQAENSLASANQSKTTAEDGLKKSYEDGFNSVSNAFLDLPTVMANLEDILYGNDFEDYQSNLDWYAWQGSNLAKDAVISDKVSKYKADTESYYQTARKLYDANFDSYKATSRNSSNEEIEALILQTYETSKAISDSIKSAKNFIDLISDIKQQYSYQNITPAAMTVHQSSLETYTGQVNSHLSSLLSAKSGIAGYKNSITNAISSIKEKEASLADLKAGSDSLDIRSAEIAVQQKQIALANAQEDLAEYSVKAPFDGVIAALSAKVGDSASSASSLATIITKQSVATITLNEVDIAKVKASQKVVLTFDAISDLEITGEVAEVDTLGTSNSGVVTYTVKIVFDVQDERIKSGMSVSANIIIDSKPDVIMVPSGAVKTQNSQSYVEVLVDGKPQQKNVTVGSNNDTMTEITEGVSEGDLVITSTVTASSKTSASKTSSGTTKASGQSGPPDGIRMMGL
jgi:HlyD family secretion protein